MSRSTPVALVLLLLALLAPLAARAAEGETAPLLEQLRTGLDPDERASAASSLAETPGPEITRALVAALDDPASSVRATVLEVLARRAEAEPGPVGEALERSLDDADPRVQLLAAALLQAKRSLAQWQSTRTRRRELLEKHFQGPDPEARRLVIMGFLDAGPMDPAELAFLVPGLRDSDLAYGVDRVLRDQGLDGEELLLREALSMVTAPEAAIRALGARELGQLPSGARSSREPLERLLAGDPDRAVRVAAAGAHLQLFRQPDLVVGALREGLQAPEVEVRSEALTILASRAVPLDSLTEGLRLNLASDATRTSVLGLLSLGQAGRVDLVPDMVKSLGDLTPLEVSVTLETLKQMGPGAVAKALPELRRLAGAKDLETRILAAVTLTDWTGDPGPATRTLAPLLQGKDPEKRSLALQGLAPIQTPVPQLVDLLVRGLQSGRLPEEAYPPLTTLQPSSAIPAALHLRMLKSQNPGVLLSALGFIAHLPPATPGVEQALLGALRGSKGPERYRIASVYYGRTGDAAPLRPLLEESLLDPDSAEVLPGLTLLFEVNDPSLLGRVLQLAASASDEEVRLAALQTAVRQGADRSEWIPLALRSLASAKAQDHGVRMLALSLREVPPSTVARYVDASTLAAVTRCLEQDLRDLAEDSPTRPAEVEFWCAILAEVGPGAAPAASLLEKTAQDPNPRIQRAVARALKALGGGK